MPRLRTSGPISLAIHSCQMTWLVIVVLSVQQFILALIAVIGRRS